jgi:hypothetical protein
MCASRGGEVGTYLGQALAVASLAVLAGDPANGAPLREYRTFDSVAYLSGSTCMLGAVLVLVVKVWAKEGLLGRT